MAVNLDKPHLWKQDTQASVDYYNRWFMRFAPKAFRDTRIEATKSVKQAIIDSSDMRALSPELLLSRPGILPTLRMSCCPPLTVDRLVALASTRKNLVRRLDGGNFPSRTSGIDLSVELDRMCRVISTLLDRSICPWLDGAKDPTDCERDRACAVIADRLLGAVAKHTVRSAQEIQQLLILSAYLDSRGYREVLGPRHRCHSNGDHATYTFFVSVPVAMGDDAFIPVDAVLQPAEPPSSGSPLFMRLESRGSLADSSRHRSFHHRAARALRMTYGKDVPFVLLLTGYFGGHYLGTQAAEGIDWVWQHRLTDLQSLGV